MSIWRSDCLPQGGEATLPLPRGLAGRCGGGQRRRYSTPRRLRGARRCLCDARRPFRRLPGGGRGACSPAASAALGEGGAGSHLSGGPAPCHSPPPLPLPTTSTLRSSGERVPAARAAGISRPSAPGAPVAGSFAPSCAPPAPTPAAAPRARSGSGRGRVGPRGVHGHPLLGRVKCQSHDSASRRNKKGGEPTHRRGVGKHNERPEVVVTVPDDLEADGAPRPRGRILLGEAVVQPPRVRQ
jgi:hypothetical protein